MRPVSEEAIKVRIRANHDYIARLITAAQEGICSQPNPTLHGASRESGERRFSLSATPRRAMAPWHRTRRRIAYRNETPLGTGFPIGNALPALAGRNWMTARRMAQDRVAAQATVGLWLQLAGRLGRLRLLIGLI